MVNASFYAAVLFSMFTCALSIHGTILRNTKYKIIIFNRKVLPKSLNRVRAFLINRYNSYVSVVNKHLIDYNGLPEDDKALIEFIISNIL